MKPTFWQRIIEAWPIIAALIGICATWWVQINMIQYRLDKAEQEIASIRVDAKENLERINTTLQRLQTDVAQLVVLTRERNVR